MAGRFDTLSDEQKNAFRERVAQLGFDPESLRDTSIVTSGSGLSISGADREFAKYVRYKTFSSIDDVKHVVGVPDGAFQRGTSDQHIKYLPAPRHADSTEVTYLALTQQEQDDLENATYAYLFGNSQKVQRWRDSINRLLLPRELSFVAAENLTVKPGAPFKITNPSYTFGTVTIEQGGQIVVQADSTLNAQLIVKT
jgi:hypothetical protein